ncbi:hypothetical protein JOF55_003567 [Haloactinomyces albus]|uniref:Uncharacterized protein n=1 Tax=Haloactinomyces albus TaxID=1352928 RepID=A0AAE4CNE8_9ACTN|nr:hypothetical protein [Haloactinomyces albus]
MPSAHVLKSGPSQPRGERAGSASPALATHMHGWHGARFWAGTGEKTRPEARVSADTHPKAAEGLARIPAATPHRLPSQGAAAGPAVSRLFPDAPSGKSVRTTVPGPAAGSCRGTARARVSGPDPGPWCQRRTKTLPGQHGATQPGSPVEEQPARRRPRACRSRGLAILVLLGGGGGRKRGWVCAAATAEAGHRGEAMRFTAGCPATRSPVPPAERIPTAPSRNPGRHPRGYGPAAAERRARGRA